MLNISKSQRELRREGSRPMISSSMNLTSTNFSNAISSTSTPSLPTTNVISNDQIIGGKGADGLGWMDEAGAIWRMLLLLVYCRCCGGTRWIEARRESWANPEAIFLFWLYFFICQWTISRHDLPTTTPASQTLGVDRRQDRRRLKQTSPLPR